MKSLYNKDFRYTKEAQILDREAHNAIEYMFDRWLAKGYSPREVSHIIKEAVTDFELEAVL